MSCSLTDCIVRGNIALTQGGGIFITDDILTITRCRVENNAVTSTGSTGGGIACTGPVNAVGCVVTGNAAAAAGGGVYCEAAGSDNVVFQGCTIAGNSSPGNGGIYFPTNGALTVVSCIIVHKSPPQVGTQGSAAVTVAASCLQLPSVGVGGSNITLDPRVVDAAQGDYHLSNASPCVNTGAVGPLAMPAMDIDGTPRLVGQVDMGADERPNATLPGTGEDFDLYAKVNDSGDPLATVIPAPAGAHLTVRLHSPGGAFVGALPLLAGQFFPTGTPPLGIVAFPAIHINAMGSFVIFGTPGAGAFSAPGLDPAGMNVNFIVPPGLTGTSLRLQAFASTPFAGNGFFAISDARDLVF
jgi:hypothetical protein